MDKLRDADSLANRSISANASSGAERIFNWILGVSILSWAILGWFKPSADRVLVVQVCVSLLHLMVGYLVLVRHRVKQSGSWGHCVAAIPAMLIGGIAFWVSAKSWSVVAQVVLALGVVMALLSFVFLGKHFSILPAVRGITTLGPYRIVRHPAYLGELFMVAGCAMTLSIALGVLLVLAAVALVMIRITAEEKLLSANAEYRQYQAEVRWKLIPLVW